MGYVYLAYGLLAWSFLIYTTNGDRIYRWRKRRKITKAVRAQKDALPVARVVKG